MAAGTTKPCLQVRGLAKSYGRLRVLEDVTAAVTTGERCAVIGPNGAGKTTLFNLIAGQLRPSSGQIWLNGHDVTALTDHQRAAMGLARTFQTTTLFPRLTVRENLALAVLAKRKERNRWLPRLSTDAPEMTEVVRLLDQVGLSHRADRPARELGHGEQRQVEILLAIAQDPSLLLLDEPTAGLAPADIPLVTGILKSLGRGVTMILIEHDMSVVFEVVERILVLHGGRLAADGSVKEVRENARVQEIYLGGSL